MRAHFLFTLLLITALPATAQHSHPAHNINQHAAHSPYADMQSRAIKALSNEQMASLQAGKGMSLALAAELNGYPGPLHTLELAEQLELSEEQKRKTQQLFNQMRAEAMALGAQVIESEGELDRLFSEKRATVRAIGNLTEKAAITQGNLRAAHLDYHLKMLGVLTPPQIIQYGLLRGYQQE